MKYLSTAEGHACDRLSVGKGFIASDQNIELRGIVVLGNLPGEHNRSRQRPIIGQHVQIAPMIGDRNHSLGPVFEGFRGPRPGAGGAL